MKININDKVYDLADESKVCFDSRWLCITEPNFCFDTSKQIIINSPIISLPRHLKKIFKLEKNHFCVSIRIDEEKKKKITIFPSK